MDKKVHFFQSYFHHHYLHNLHFHHLFHLITITATPFIPSPPPPSFIPPPSPSPPLPSSYHPTILPPTPTIIATLFPLSLNPSLLIGALVNYHDQAKGVKRKRGLDVFGDLRREKGWLEVEMVDFSLFLFFFFFLYIFLIKMNFKKYLIKIIKILLIPSNLMEKIDEMANVKLVQ